MTEPKTLTQTDGLDLLVEARAVIGDRVRDGSATYEEQELYNSLCEALKSLCP